MCTSVFSQERHKYIHPYECRLVHRHLQRYLHCTKMHTSIRLCPHSSRATGADASEKTPHQPLLIQHNSDFPFQAERNGGERESTWLPNPVINACQEHFWWDLKILREVGPSWSNGTSWTQEQQRRSETVTQRLFPSVFLGNNEQILQSDYSVTPAGPALKSVLDGRCSYLLLD